MFIKLLLHAYTLLIEDFKFLTSKYSPKPYLIPVAFCGTRLELEIPGMDRTITDAVVRPTSK